VCSLDKACTSVYTANLEQADANDVCSVPTISDYSNINVCSKGMGTEMGSCHQYTSCPHKWVVYKLTLLDLQSQNRRSACLRLSRSCHAEAVSGARQSAVEGMSRYWWLSSDACASLCSAGLIMCAHLYRVGNSHLPLIAHEECHFRIHGSGSQVFTAGQAILVNDTAITAGNFPPKKYPVWYLQSSLVTKSQWAGHVHVVSDAMSLWLDS